jgi:hypothetical protein
VHPVRYQGLVPTPPPDLPHSLLVTDASDIRRIRQRNEDSFALAPEQGVAVVADGVSGHQDEDVASRIAADVTLELLLMTVEGGGRDLVSRVQSAIEHAVVAAHESIRARAKVEPEPGPHGRDADRDGRQRGGESLRRGPRWRLTRLSIQDRIGVLSQITRGDTWVQQKIENK